MTRALDFSYKHGAAGGGGRAGALGLLIRTYLNAIGVGNQWVPWKA